MAQALTKKYQITVHVSNGGKPMKVKLDDCYTEIGRLYMDTVLLRQALTEEQQEIAKLTTGVGSLRQRHAKLSQAAIEQEENIITLNERLMGRGKPQKVANAPPSLK